LHQPVTSKEVTSSVSSPVLAAVKSPVLSAVTPANTSCSSPVVTRRYIRSYTPQKITTGSYTSIYIPSVTQAVTEREEAVTA
jgi:hypothetical protein